MPVRFRCQDDWCSMIQWTADQQTYSHNTGARSKLRSVGHSSQIQPDNQGFVQTPS
jgi:hypothetical protein